MGTAASVGISVVLERATACDIENCVARMDVDARRRLEDVITKTTTHALTENTGVEALQGYWRATRVTEWGPCAIPVKQRSSFYVYYFDAQGRYILHHHPHFFGCVRRASHHFPGTFEAEGEEAGQPTSTLIELLPGRESMEWNHVESPLSRK